MNINIDQIIYRVLDQVGLWHIWIETTEDMQNEIRKELLNAILAELEEAQKAGEQ